MPVVEVVLELQELLELVELVEVEMAVAVVLELEPQEHFQLEEEVVVAQDQLLVVTVVPVS